jgi:hypothetical protein
MTATSGGGPGEAGSLDPHAGGSVPQTIVFRYKEIGYILCMKPRKNSYVPF